MKALVQYPDVLSASSVATDSVRDANGNWVTPDSSLITQKCRVEANTRGQKLTTADGTAIQFDWLVYMPFSAGEVAAGSPVSITRDGQTVATGTVKRFFRGQLNSRLWL